MRQSARRRVFNLRTKDKYKEALKKFRKLVATSKKAEAVQAMSEATSFLDKAAKKHILHKNKASRLKARMAAALAKLTT